ncbi:MAG: 50S ribosomal protein L9 [Lentisphaeria bacterium]|nr:50S ribosomal protein L9 [Lentisphaeria bacterium]
MAVELMLMEDVHDLGRLGDRVRVAEGYARNYLLPRKLAVPITPSSLRMLEARKLRLQQEYEQRVAVAQAMADKIGKTSITLTVEAGENDKLYGSVAAMQLQQALSEQGLDVERHAFQLEEPIRELGVYTVEVVLHEQVKANLKVWVVRS